MTKWLLLVVCLGIACQDVTSAAVNHQRKSSKNLAHSMKVIYEWKHIDYDFGSVERRDAAIKSGEFNHTKNYPFDVDRWRDKTFVTVERFDGVPSSLNVVTNKKGKGGPLLHPYPDWSWANYKDCSGIVSAFKIAVDKFDRLWVLDSGLVNNNQAMCSPKLVTFDLNTSKLLKQVEIPHNIAVNATTGMGELVSLAVQAIDPTNTMVYIADERGEALIIYQNSDDSFHRLTSNTFDYDPRYTKLTVAGESFTVKNGICGIALSPVTNNLYYSPLASHSLYYVNTEQFRNSQYEESNVQYEGSQDILNTQSFAKAVSKNGVVFLGLVSNSAVGCVNEHQVLQKENFDVVAQNEETLQMIVSMKIMQDLPQSGRINDPGNEYMLALSNKMQKIINNDFNFNDVNFRILGANVNDLTRNTRCAKSNNQNANNQNANNQNANNQNANNQNANNQNDNNQNDNGNNRRNGNNQNGNRQNDNKQNDNKQNANKQNANKQNDNKQNDNRQNDNRQNDNKKNDNRQNDNKQNGNRQNDNRQSDNQRNGNRQNDNRQNDNKRNGNRQNDNRQNDNKRNGNRQNDNKQNDNRQNDNNQNDNQNDNNRNNQAHHS